MSTATELKLEIEQPPFNTSHLGVMSAASAYFGLHWTAPELFVHSGHAFVTNVRIDLCPSGPYVWNITPMLELFTNLNLDVEMIGFILYEKSSDEERTAFDETIKQALLAGKICTLECLDHQVISGFDEKGFTLTQPWGADMKDSTPPRLDFGSWEGFSSGVPLCVFAVSKRDDALKTTREMLQPAVQYALDVWDNPKSHSEDPNFGMGPAAYPNWLKAIEDGFGNQHGAWWNATVWSECKIMASRFFDKASGDFNGESTLLKQIAEAYKNSALAMMEASDQKLDAAPKKAAVRNAEQAETEAVEGLRELSTLI